MHAIFYEIMIVWTYHFIKINDPIMKKIYLLMLCLGCAHSIYGEPLIGMGNPFSFEVDGVRFDEATNSEEKAEWGQRTQDGEDPMNVAKEILQRKMPKRRKRCTSKVCPPINVS